METVVGIAGSSCQVQDCQESWAGFYEIFSFVVPWIRPTLQFAATFDAFFYSIPFIYFIYFFLFLGSFLCKELFSLMRINETNVVCMQSLVYFYSIILYVFFLFCIYKVKQGNNKHFCYSDEYFNFLSKFLSLFQFILCLYYFRLVIMQYPWYITVHLFHNLYLFVYFIINQFTFD